MYEYSCFEKFYFYGEINLIKVTAINILVHFTADFYF